MPFSIVFSLFKYFKIFLSKINAHSLHELIIRQLNRVQRLYDYTIKLIIILQHMSESTGTKVSQKRQPVTIVSGHRNETDLQDIQASSKINFNCSVQRTEIGEYVYLICINSLMSKCRFFCKYRKKDNSSTSQQYLVIYQNLSHEDAYQKISQTAFVKNEFVGEESAEIVSDSLNQQQNKLYCIQEINWLKKQLQYESKGLLSKSTELNKDKSFISEIRFKCKNFPLTICPYLHILQYKKTINQKFYYQSRAICSTHTQQCLLDNDSIQQNIIIRKIDSAVQTIEKIVREDQNMKPKDILQKLANTYGQDTQKFIYGDICQDQKTIKRSIKKYFDNTVAKIKNKIKLNPNIKK